MGEEDVGKSKFSNWTYGLMIAQLGKKIEVT